MKSKRKNNLNGSVVFSPRETEVLAMLSLIVLQGGSIDGGIPLTLGISMWIFFLGFWLMQFLRPRLPFLYYPRVFNEGDEKPHWLSFENASWIARALTAGKDYIGKRAGMYGLLFLRFEVFMFLYVLVMACLAIPILVPLNILAGGGSQGFAITTATNVPEKSLFLVAHTILTIIFVILGLLIIFWYQSMYKRTKNVFRNRNCIDSRTVFIRNVPKKTTEGEMRVFMEELFPSQVASVSSPPEAGILVSLQKKKESYKAKLRRAEAIFTEKGDRPTIRPGTCGFLATRLGLRAKEDAMRYYKEKIADISATITRRQKFPYPLIGVAFVTFKEGEDAFEMTKTFYFSKMRKEKVATIEDQDLVKRLRPSGWHVSKAENPNTIYWQNLGYSTTSKSIRRIMIFFLMLALSITWSIPISFLASVETLQTIPGLGSVVTSFVDLNPFFQDVIEGYIPSLLTTLFVLCLPAILNRVVPFEKPSTVAVRNASILRLYYTFIILNVLIFPTFLIGTLDSLALLFDDGITSVLASIDFTLQGSFFVNYVIQQTFFSGMIRLVRISHLFQYYWFMAFTKTEEEKESVRKRAAHEMEYRIRFAQMLVVIGVLLTYAVIVPLILPTGLVFLIVIHIIDRNNILHVFPTTRAGDSSMIISVINMFMIALIIYQILTAIFFWFQEALYGFICVMILLFITLCCIALLNFVNWYNTYYNYFRKGSPLIVAWDVPTEIIAVAYTYPGMVPEENDSSESARGQVQRAIDDEYGDNDNEEDYGGNAEMVPDDYESDGE